MLQKKLKKIVVGIFEKIKQERFIYFPEQKFAPSCKTRVAFQIIISSLKIS